MAIQEQSKENDTQSNLPDRLLKALEEANKRCLLPPQTVPEPCANDKNALLSCEPPQATSDPEATLVFRRPLPLQPVTFAAPEPGEGNGSAFQIGCVNLFSAGVDASLAIDLLYEQRWCFKSHIVSALATTISLAPTEILHVTIHNTQRKLFDRTNLKEVEQSESTESTIVDRDIVNITRSSTTTNNWSVSGNSTVSIPIEFVELGFGLSGELSQSITDTAQTSAEQVTEATRKSATTLRTLQKLEVKETVETIEERERSRVITNPYRDRALRLNVYNLAKEYCVEFALTHLRPVIILEFSNITFDNSFVLANSSFLEGALQDTALRLELSNALETATDAAFGSALKDAQKLSELALKYLFEVPNIFNVQSIFVTSPVPSTLDGNDPNLPFDAQLGPSGLKDALATKYGKVFTTLNFYYKLYKNEVPSDPGLALTLVLSLEEALRPWLATEEGETVGDILDEKDLTEVFRRLSGFLAFVSGSIRPLLRPAEEEKQRIEAARRAEFVISRVVDHLQCHKDYYIGQYLRYFSNLTGGLTIKRFVENVLSQISNPPELKDKWIDLFAVAEAFIDSNSIIVPGLCLYDEEASSVLIEIIDGEQKSDIRFGVLRADRVTVPADGSYIEPAAGSCVLPDVPTPIPSPLFRVSIAEDPLHVSVSQETR
jgi:hypothetical protein